MEVRVFKESRGLKEEGENMKGWRCGTENMVFMVVRWQCKENFGIREDRG